jgi:hypothetical protein
MTMLQSNGSADFLELMVLFVAAAEGGLGIRPVLACHAALQEGPPEEEAEGA